MTRALVISNMLPDDLHPERGRFVRDQVDALRALPDVEVVLHEFAPGARAGARAVGELARRYRNEHFDVVHAHFGLTAWPALVVGARLRALTVHGTDVRHPRSRQATRLALPLMGLVGVVSEALIGELPSRRARARARILPCGVDLIRFRELSRPQARLQLGLDPDRPLLLFAADPRRADKRYDRAVAVAQETPLAALGGVDPEMVPLWINAANAVLMPSEHEGFGLAVLEALACNVPVLATPVGIHPIALTGLTGALCAPFELERWREAVAPHVREEDPRIRGRERAEPFSALRMAQCVGDAWHTYLSQAG